MITKKLNSRCLLLLLTLLLTVTASADSYFFIDDLVIKPTDFGKTITVPVKASFDKPVSSWDVEFVFPDGLIPTKVVAGSDMVINYIDDNGMTSQYRCFPVFNGSTNVFGCTYGRRGFMDDEHSGLIKWESGTYNEMLLITFTIFDFILDEEIQIHTSTSCCYDNDPSSGITEDQSVTDYILEADANQDDIISVADLSFIIDVIVTGDYEDLPRPGGQYTVGDLNHDGSINLIDVDILCDYMYYYQWFEGYELNECTVSCRVTTINNLPTDVSFYIDPLEISPEDLGHDITIPVKATFEGYTSSWDVEFVFPEGITPVGYTPGSDMTLNALSSQGTQETFTAGCVANNEYTHFISATLHDDYQSDGEGSYEFCGTAKWLPGEYEEMLLLTLHVEEYFGAGDILVLSKSSCGKDIRNDALVFWPEEMTIPENQYYPGDVDADGLVSFNDITLYMLYLTDNTFSFFETSCADVHADGVIDLLDMEKVIDLVFHDEWLEGYVLNDGGSCSVPAYVNFPPIIPGDVNGDGQITISDVTSLIDMLLSMDYIEYNELIDVNGDGNISIADVTALIDKLLSQP